MINGVNKNIDEYRFCRYNTVRGAIPFMGITGLLKGGSFVEF